MLDLTININLDRAMHFDTMPKIVPRFENYMLHYNSLL